MKLRRALCAAALSAACAVAGCRQSDGAWPAEKDDVPNRLHDLQRDIESVAGGEADAPKDLADDLAVFTADPEGVAASRTLAGSVSVVLVKRKLTEDSLKQLATILWKAVGAHELSERQVDALKDDMRGTLISIGVAQSDANAVADRVGQTQKAVTQRTRRWYERY
jgi:outer membrane murein-binding lipoprotein Lpp